MAQILKTDVRNSIDDAALKVFFEKGFFSAKMADIAKTADISVGNIYRYYKNKEDLYHAVVPPERVSAIKEMLVRRIEAAHGIADLRMSGPEDTYWIIFEEQLEFMLEHRQLVVILLRKSRGTVYENFQQELVEMIKLLTRSYMESVNKRVESIPESDFTLELIYTHLMNAFADTLEHFENKRQARLIIKSYLKYHLAGLKMLFA